MSTYNPVIQETGQDLEILGANHYNLQVAKAVSSPGGKATFNIVYASKDLEPTMSVAWTTKYGLNWTTNIPNPGAKVICSGSWQACPAGQSFDLSKVGTWKVSENNTNADKNSLNVGSNMYSTAVNIVVGVFDPDTKKWAPIWVAPNKLVVQGHGEYQPREAVQIWFTEGVLDAAMISSQSSQATPLKEFDMTGVPLYYFHYVAATGIWQDQPTLFPDT